MVSPNPLLETNPSRRAVLASVLLAAATASTSCSEILETRWSDYRAAEETGGAGQTGQGGQGNTGTGGETPEKCSPGEKVDCYSGPPETQQSLPCHGGMKQCLPGGKSWGPCEGEVLPQPEICETDEDEDCDGGLDVEDGCGCEAGTVAPCYEGPPGTEGVGICSAGTKQCEDDGWSWTACQGQVLPEVEPCGTLDLDENCDGDLDCKLDWSKSFGVSGTTGIGHLAIDPGGRLIVGGQFNGEVAFGQSVWTNTPGAAPDLFVAVLDTEGEAQWSKAFGTPVGGQEYLADVQVDPEGNIFLAGGFLGGLDLGAGPMFSVGLAFSMFVAKLDPSGALSWARSFGDGEEIQGRGIAVDGAGCVVVTGSFRGTLDWGCGPLTSAGNDDVFLVKLDPSGTCLWSRSFGDAVLVQQVGERVAIGPLDGIVLAGGFGGTVDFGDGPLTAQQQDVFVASLDAQGDAVWSRALPNSLYTTGLGVDSAGRAFVIGSNLSDGVEIVQFDDAGQILWEKAFAEPGVGLTGAAAPTDHLLLAGLATGPLDLGAGPLADPNDVVDLDVVVAKLNADGMVAWARRFGDEKGQGASAIVGDTSGHVYVAGTFQGSIDFGAGPLSAPSGTKSFLVKFRP